MTTSADPVYQAGNLYEEYVRIAEIASLAELVSEPAQPQTYFTAPPLGFVVQPA